MLLRPATCRSIPVTKCTIFRFLGWISWSTRTSKYTWSRSTPTPATNWAADFWPELFRRCWIKPWESVSILYFLLPITTRITRGTWRRTATLKNFNFSSSSIKLVTDRPWDRSTTTILRSTDRWRRYFQAVKIKLTKFFRTRGRKLILSGWYDDFNKIYEFS